VVDPVQKRMSIIDQPLILRSGVVSGPNTKEQWQ
jgi:hypothetical protein